jgi:DNA polymerase-4
LGLHTVSDIAHTPRATLIRALGESTGASLYELAWGRDYRDVIPDEPEKSIGNEETFSEDLDNPEEILREFLRMTEKATARLRERSLFAKQLASRLNLQTSHLLRDLRLCRLQLITPTTPTKL